MLLSQKKVVGDLVCHTRDLVFVAQDFRFLLNQKEITFGEFIGKIPCHELRLVSSSLNIIPEEFRPATKQEIAGESYPLPESGVYYLKSPGHKYFLVLHI